MERQGIGPLVRAARLRKGWSQRALAARLDVDKSYISLIETNARRWPEEYIAALASELGLRQVDMALAAGLISEGLPSVYADPFPKGSPAARVTDLMKAMSDEEVGFLLTTAEFIETHSAHDRDNETDGPRPKQQIG